MSPTTSPMSPVSALTGMLLVFVIVSATTDSVIVCLFLAHPTKVPFEGRGMGFLGWHLYSMLLDELQIRGGLSIPLADK